MKVWFGFLYTLSHYNFPPDFSSVLLDIQKVTAWGFYAIESLEVPMPYE